MQDYVLMVAAAKTETLVRRSAESIRRGGSCSSSATATTSRTLAIDAGVRALIVTGGFPVPREIQAKAEARGVTVVRSRHDTATTVLLARGAVRAGRMVEREFVYFEPDVAAGSRARAGGVRRRNFAFPGARRRASGSWAC